jgi:hypothetical protein
LSEEWKAYVGILIATIVLIVVATLVVGCSGAQPTHDGPVSNNTTAATFRPDSPTGTVYSSTSVGTEVNLSIYPLIGYDAAINSVRSFIGNPVANVSCESLEYDDYVPMYLLVSNSDSFLVNAWAGEIDYAAFLSNPVGNFFSGNVINGEQGRSIAQAFAAEHYPGFDANARWHYLGSALHQDDKGGYFYEYKWREFAGDVETLNDVIVTVGVGSSKIHTYQAIRVPAGYEDSFTVYRRDAARIAASALGNITRENTLTDDAGKWTFDVLFKYAFPDENGSLYGDYMISGIVIRPDLARNKDNLQRVIWNVDLAAGPAPENGNTPITWQYTFLVDAGTGEVLQVIHYR